MQLHRAFGAFGAPFPTCLPTLNAHTPQLDGGNIYGSLESYLRSTLRAPGSCYMRTSVGNHLPLTTTADGDGLFHFIAGDVRVSEHAFLSAQHTVRETSLQCFHLRCSLLASEASADGIMKGRSVSRCKVTVHKNAIHKL